MVLLVLVGFTLIERVAYAGDVLPGVAVPGVSIAGASEDDARAQLQELADRLESEPVRAQHDDVVLYVDPQDVGFEVDVDATLQAAREAGRGRNPVAVVQGMVLRRFRDDDVPLVVRYDRDREAKVLGEWAGHVADGLENGSLRFEGAKVIEVPPKSGVGLQLGTARDRLEAELANPDRGTIALPVGPASPAVGITAVHRAAAEARRLLSQPTVITAETTPITVTPEQLAATLGTKVDGRALVLTIDTPKLYDELQPQLAPLETAAQDATWAISGSSATVVPSIPSKSVDLTKVSEQILQGSHAVTAEMISKEPEHDTAWATKQNITGLVSTFTTPFTPGQPRVTNIRTAAAALNGTIVEAGETFSLNAKLGPRTLEKGYVSAPAIAGDLSYYDDVGGGVSQVSTTLWNATFFGGYKDVTHSAHSLYISRYPMGREATLNYPSIDNKFTNDSPNGILIQAYAGASSLTVSYYSTSDGRTVKAEGPNILETIEPTIETTTDPLKVQSGYKGYVVEVFRIISRPGQPDVRQRFVTRYSMRPEKVLAPVAPPPAATTTAPAPPPAPPPAPVPAPG